jgi:AraC-like DNA-binding protein
MDVMNYKEFLPSENLKAFVKCFYLCEYEDNIVFQDKAFATGCMEIMFNLGNGSFETGRGHSFSTTPRIELWGQIINPLQFKSLGKNKMLGIRFYPHTAAIFLDDRIDIFNDRVFDFAEVAGEEARVLHDRLLESSDLMKQISLLESFLMKKLLVFKERNSTFDMVSAIIKEMQGEDFFDNIQDIASRYGITSRYLQRLFVQYTGLSPKLYIKINRFQKSLMLTSAKEESLTTVAYLSGYFDQSHFVRDFKLFTGVAPSVFDPSNSSAILFSPNKK